MSYHRPGEYPTTLPAVPHIAPVVWYIPHPGVPTAPPDVLRDQLLHEPRHDAYLPGVFNDLATVANSLSSPDAAAHVFLSMFLCLTWVAAFAHPLMVKNMLRYNFSDEPPNADLFKPFRVAYSLKWRIIYVCIMR